MVVRLTSRGKRLLTIAASLLLLAILFQDWVIASAGLFTLLLISYSLTSAARLSQVKFYIAPVERKVKAIAGRWVKFSLEIKAESQDEWRFELSQAGELVPEYRDGFVDFSGAFYLSGIRRISLVDAKAESSLLLFIITRRFRFDPVELVVYPRFMVPLQRILGYELVEVPEEESHSTRLSITKFGEYAGTRDYHPGDEARYIDWKATARTQSLKVKEFTSNRIGFVNIIFDVTSTDEESADKLATEFFNTLLDYLDQGATVNPLLYDGKSFKSVNPKLAVQQITLAALEMLGKYNAEIGRILDLPIEGWRKELSVLMPSAIAYDKLKLRGRMVVITQLLSDVMDSLLSPRPGEIVVIQPTQPWVAMDSLEDAYLAWKEIRKKVKALRSISIPVLEAKGKPMAWIYKE